MLGWLRTALAPREAVGTPTRRETQLREALDLIEEVQRDVKSLRLEWEETYESVNRALRKMAKREKRAEEDCGCGKSEPAVENGNGGQMLSLAEARRRYPMPGTF